MIGCCIGNETRRFSHVLERDTSWLLPFPLFWYSEKVWMAHQTCLKYSCMYVRRGRECQEVKKSEKVLDDRALARIRFQHSAAVDVAADGLMPYSSCRHPSASRATLTWRVFHSINFSGVSVCSFTLLLFDGHPRQKQMTATRHLGYTLFLHYALRLSARKFQTEGPKVVFNEKKRQA